MREIVKPFLELLGGVPTIVYGYFALTVVSPVLQYFPSLPGFSMLAAGLVMGIAIVPYISSLSEDAMRAVPMSLREGAYAMGSTRFQTAVRVVLPAAISGVLSAYILGISRSRRDHDRGGCCRHAAELHHGSDAAGADDFGLHRASRNGRPAAWFDRISIDFRCWSEPDAADPVLQHHGHLIRRRYREAY